MDKVDWTEIVEEFYPKIYRFTFQFFGNTADAEDVTQDVFLKAYNSFGELKDPKAIKYWLYAIARNQSIDRKRWWKRTKDFIARNFDTKTELEGDNQYVSKELSFALRKIIASLSLKQREVFILRHWHDFSTEETAKFLNISSGTVKSHLQRAVQKVKAELLRDEEAVTTTQATETSS